MTREVIQVVDRGDIPIGTAPMSEVRECGLAYRVARVMLEAPDGSVLLQRRSAERELYPGRWDNSAAGHVGVSEDYSTAAARELAEEVGIQVADLTEIDYYYAQNRFKDMKLNEWNKVYRAVGDKTLTLSLQPDEVAEAEWFDRDQLIRLAKKPEELTHGLLYVIGHHYV